LFGKINPKDRINRKNKVIWDIIIYLLEYILISEFQKVNWKKKLEKLADQNK